MARRDLTDEAGSPAERSGGSLQTLDRGLRVLELVSSQGAGLAVSELAEELGVHRAIAYRLASTLEAHHLVVRGADGRLRLGSGLMMLADRFMPQLRAASTDTLRSLADQTQASAFLSVAQGVECVAIAVAEPNLALFRVAYRVASRHPLSLGAAGIAILSGRPEQPSDTAAVRQARRDGFALTRGQLQVGAIGLASPIHQADFPTQLGFEASIGIVTLHEFEIPTVSRKVMAAADAVRRALRGEA